MEESKDLLPTFETTTTEKSSMVKWFLPFLGLVILVEVIIGVKTLLSPIPAAGKIASLYGGKIALIPSQSAYKVGDNVAVAVRVSTGGRATVGTDLVLKYDPTYLQASSKANFLRGEIYKDYPIISIDNNAGLVKISGVDSPGESGFSGVGILGELIFTAKQQGQTKLAVQFKPGATNLSNVIENKTASNILDQVYDLDVNINGSSQSQTNKAPSCSQRVLQMCVDDQGRLGSQWCTNIQDPLVCQVGCFKDSTGDDQGCRVIPTSYSPVSNQSK